MVKTRTLAFVLAILGLAAVAGCTPSTQLTVDRNVANPHARRRGVAGGHLSAGEWWPIPGAGLSHALWQAQRGAERSHTRESGSARLCRSHAGRAWPLCLGRDCSIRTGKKRADGYDTIEWAAAQAWSDGRVGTYGLSYPGAVQWLAAMKSPPHLLSMAPAMTFSSPRNFFYMNGIFDLSWLPWIYQYVAPDARRRLGLPVGEDAEQTWPSVASKYQSWLPLKDLPWLRQEAPYYFEWLAHPPEDPWWDWAELRGRYANVSAAVLNLSGWFDDAYGVEGAATNFNGLVQARSGQASARTHLVLGPWVHGVPSPTEARAGDLDFGPNAVIDYDELVLDFHDHYLRGVANGFAEKAPVRYFVMGANEWRDASRWPPPASRAMTLYLDADDGGRRLRNSQPGSAHSQSIFTADPLEPVRDPHDSPGAHDYRALESRKDLLTFDSDPLSEDLWIAGDIAAVIHASCDCRDFDLWVRLQDVHPDGRAFNVMSPGNDVLRASYRDAEAGRETLEPGRIYELRLPKLMTSMRFAKGHRIRAQISASFAPHLSRNLQTGESEVVSSAARTAAITIHHGADHASKLQLPILTEPDQDR